MDGLFSVGKVMPLRKSHENPEVLWLFKEFLKEPGGEISHRRLHTGYTDRGW